METLLLQKYNFISLSSMNNTVQTVRCNMLVCCVDHTFNCIGIL